MKTLKQFILFLLLVSNFLFSQNKEPQFIAVFLDNDRISEVNLDESKFIDDFGKINNLLKLELKDTKDNQKIGVLCTFHKIGKPTYQIFSAPKVTKDFESNLLSKLNAIQISNTKIVDFNVLISINSGVKGDEIEGYKNPIDKKFDDYSIADLKTKLEFNKKYATEEVLPVLSQYQVIVEDKFQGVKNFGKLLQKTDYNKPQNIDLQTSKNYDYWRANMEMSLGNQLIPTSKIAMLVSQGELDYAFKYVEILKYFGEKESISTLYLDELYWRLSEFYKAVNNEVEKGIAEHDKGNYEKALEIYNNILNDYPNSSWTLYEKYFTQNTLDIKNKKTGINDRDFWDASKGEIYKHNPIYMMDVHAKGEKEMYLMKRRFQINELFKENDKFIDDLYEYADISLDLGVYDFAAQMFWLSASYDEKHHEKALNRYLYCLEKLGVTNLKTNFEGDFSKIFSDIEKEKEAAIKK